MLQSKDIIYPELSYKINGILFGVRKNLGQYKNEKQYCDAIEEELKKNKINYEREKIIPESFSGEQKGRNKIDFLIDDKIILEVKAKPFITKNDYYQIRRYLDSLDKKLGFWVNMRKYSVNPKRILNSKCSHN
ncbi:MAG: GxxExxY protein [Candidatus Parcubacteria bacterium]|nr:GxxExxY protein [Candidatus Parcubacteria bacterium]